MERIEHNVDLIDLGAASVETKGEPNVIPELSNEQPRAGIADD